MNEDRLYRAVERMEARQIEQGQHLASLTTRVDERFDATDDKLDSMHARIGEHDRQLADHAKDIEQARGVTKLVGTLATAGFFGWLLTTFKMWLGSGTPQ